MFRFANKCPLALTLVPTPKAYRYIALSTLVRGHIS